MSPSIAGTAKVTYLCPVLREAAKIALKRNESILWHYMRLRDKAKRGRT